MAWQELAVESEALRGNPLGDPSVRPLFVWTPPGHEGSEQRLPSLYLLHAMLGQARSWFNVAPFWANLPARIERLELEAVVVLVDGFTSLGGAQWIDSPAIGDYGRYLCDEVVPFVDERFRTLPEASHRGIAGKSSGGFGAAVWSLRRPDLFGGFASHAGDALFEVTLAAELAPAAQALRNLYDGSYERFWADFRSGRPVLGNSTDALLQNVYATSAAFSPAAGGGVDLPFLPATGELRPEVFSRWLEWDPVRLAADHRDAVRGMQAIWVDAGRNDEYRLDLGAVALYDAVSSAGPVGGAAHFELFDGSHRGLDHRLELSLPFLLERLAPQ